MTEPSPGQPEQRSAEELAAEARRGSSACFVALVDRFGPRLLRYLKRRAGDAHTAEDLCQETFLRVHRNLSRYDPSRSFAAWLFTIATRLAISQGRRKRPRTGPIGDRPDPSARSPSASAAEEEQRRNLWAVAREALSADQFTALWLRYAEEMPLQQISEATRKSPGAVKALLHRARLRMVSELGARDNDESPENSSGRPLSPDRTEVHDAM